MSFPTEVQVLVVGAGPVGLTSALTLAHLGVHVAIVDSSSTNKNGSRASIVHAHTLEVLDTIGLAQPLIEAGLRSQGVLFRTRTNKLIEFDVSQLEDATKYPMSLHIPQNELEKIFQERFTSGGIQIFRNKSVVDIRDGDVAHGAEVVFEDGGIIRTRYIVGADGSRSTVRRLAGIQFKDPDTGVAYDQRAPPALQVVLADVYLKEPLPASLPRDRLSGYLDNFLMLVPFRSGPASEETSFWRIGYGIPVGGPEAPQNPSLKYLQQQMDERNPWGAKVDIASVISSSRYRVRSAVASSYFEKTCNGNILLAGDAAHVHSPAGGQGMNLGICDAVALGHAIHSHMEAIESGLGEKGDASLQAYAASRRKIAIRVISLAKGLTMLINAHSGWRKLVRNVTLLIVRHLPYMSRLSAWRLSGLGNSKDSGMPENKI